MVYSDTREGVFLSRPNRFIANIEIDGKTQLCHVKNTGRLGELLISGARVVVQKAQSPTRKTKYDLIAVYKGTALFNIDSQAPNKVFGEWAASCGRFGNIRRIKPEFKYQNSRFDFLIETDTDKFLIEVKGVTLEQDGVLLFPDAPTIRGVKHITELCHAINDGYRSAICFVVQTDTAKYFTPNGDTHPEFKAALLAARKTGVEIMCLCCRTEPNILEIKDFVPTKL